MKRSTVGLLLLCMLFVVVGCASSGPYTLDMMPPPAYFDETQTDVFPEGRSSETPPRVDILYATDREPAGVGDDEPYYRNEIGSVLRLGVATVRMGEDETTWDEMCAESLRTDRRSSIPMQVEHVKELGVDEDTVFPLIEHDVPHEVRVGGRRFAEEVNARLRESVYDDVYIFVHGYRVNYENPILITAELWHFLGYQGVFIAFSWPSTPSLWAYFADLETGGVSARSLRFLLEYLSDHTDARRIHIIGYSAGTRVVAGALLQLAYLNSWREEDEIQRELRIGNVILAASDLNRQAFGAALLDGITRPTENIMLYMSEADSALSLSRFFFKRSRVGTLWKDGELDPRVVDGLRTTDRLSLVNVSEAERALSGNGHRYFSNSPWVSSDLLSTLSLGMSPEERGLVRKGDSPVWEFPSDYIERLREGVQKAWEKSSVEP